MEIRTLTANSYESIIALWSKAGLPFKPKGRDSREAIEAQIVANPEFFLGAFDNKCLIGTVVLCCDGRKGWINRLAVDPDYRRHGVARNLIAESEIVLRKCGISIFCALIEDYNDRSKKLFKKCGYVEHRDIIYFTKRDGDDV